MSVVHIVQVPEPRQTWGLHIVAGLAVHAPPAHLLMMLLLPLHLPSHTDPAGKPSAQTPLPSQVPVLPQVRLAGLIGHPPPEGSAPFGMEPHVPVLHV
jgi:hypothetical protein